MKLIVGILSLFVVTISFSQTKIYRGDFKSLSNLVYEIKSDQITRVTDGTFRSPIFYREGNMIYFGRTKSFTEVMYRIQDNQIFQGNSNSSFNLLYTFVDNKVYLGEGRFGQKVLYTIVDGKIYLGDSTSTFDLIMSYDLDNEQDLIFLVAVISPY